MDTAMTTAAIGLGATLIADGWTLLRRRLFGTAMPDYGLVGRWIGHMQRGRFRHDSISAAASIAGERVIGWTMHYLIGIAFAALLLVMVGPQWARTPTLAPALLLGIGTVAAPFLLLQPAFGAGIAASRTSHPWIARLHSLSMHTAFGLGLYIAAKTCSWLLAT